VQAQAEVASNEERVIVAEAVIKRAQDNLRALILDPSTPTSGHVLRAERRGAVPATGDRPRRRRPQRARQASDCAAQEQPRAQRHHIRLLTTRSCRSERAGELRRDRHRRRAAPGENPFTGEFTGSITSPIERGYTSALGDVFRKRLSAMDLRLQQSLPIGASASRANLGARETRVPAGADAAEEHGVAGRHAGARVGQKRADQPEGVQSARASRELQEKKLEAEEKKAGRRMSTSFFVFQAQRDLAQARTAEIQAISDYKQVARRLRSRAAAPINGGAGTSTVAGQQNILGQIIGGQQR
jgi:hypothetical protein